MSKPDQARSSVSCGTANRINSAKRCSCFQRINAIQTTATFTQGPSAYGALAAVLQPALRAVQWAAAPFQAKPKRVELPVDHLPHPAETPKEQIDQVGGLGRRLGLLPAGKALQA